MKDTGIVGTGKVYIYDCPLSEIKLTYEEGVGRNVHTLKENHLYDDETGQLHVFHLEKPKSDVKEPWVTLELNSDGSPYFKFNPNRYPDTEEKFKKSELSDIGLMKAMNDIPDRPIRYNELVEKSMTRAGAIYRPIIKETDDYLKKLTKCHIILSGVDVKNEFKAKMKTQYQMSNNIQSLDGSSKQNPLAFAEWADWNGLDFEIIMRDNPDVTKKSKLDGELVFHSNTNTITFRKDGEEYECVKFDGRPGDYLKETPEESEDPEEFDGFDGDNGSEDESN